MKRFEDSFFVKPDAVTEDTVTITGGEAKHIAAVLRRRPGDGIIVIDGRGRRYEIELTSCTSAEIVGAIKGVEEFLPEGPELWIAVGLIRTPRMDVLVEKCTELGVHTMVPLRTRRSLSSKGVSDARLARWERVAAAAMTQSSRLFLPRVCEPVSVEGFIDLVGAKASLFLADPLGGSMEGVDRALLSAEVVAGCVGPEGGFSPDEIGSLVNAGALPVSLSRARLRTETAAMALLDRLSFLAERVAS
jgi:16S rRNA (uracil1498-N3)-methyltransferase